VKRTLIAFAAVGGVLVPVVFTLLGWALPRLAGASGEASALLHDVQLPLWPMSKLILDAPAGKHWLYLPLAALLSNALVYVAIGALATWGRGNRAAFAAAVLVTLALLAAGWLGFGTSSAGFAIAAALALAGLVAHHRLAR
jgi:hypothetical protein